MSIIGKWKVAYLLAMGEDSFVWQTPDEYRAEHTDEPEDTEKTLSTILEFAEGGKVYCCFPIPPEAPQEQIDEAIKAGQIRVKDGCVYDESTWKEEDGTLNFMGMQRYEKI